MTDRTPSLRAALLAGSIAALVKLALSLPFLGRYGWHRDELYFLQASRHLAFGYVDFPPMTALAGRAVVELFGPSLVALRLTGVAAGMLAIALVALCVRELGGGFRSQLGASLAFTVTPFGLGLGALFHPTMLDVPVWAGFSYVALRILGRPEPRLLPVLGLIAGIGLETKDTVLALIVVSTASLAVFGPRTLFRDRRLLLAAGIALGCTLPFTAWQIAHGWPSIEFLSSQASKTAGDTAPPAYLGQQLAFLGGALPLVVTGVVTLWRRPPLRALSLVAPLVSVLFLIEQGRSYYALPAVLLPLAAGVVTAGRWLGATRARLWLVGPVAALQVAALALVAPLLWPVLSERTMVDRGIWNDTFYKDEIGWPELTQQTVAAWRAIPAPERRDTAILARNYGEAGALALYGPRWGLPAPLSGHLAFQYWRPAQLPQRHALTIGFAPGELARLCTSWHAVAHIENPWRIANEERGRTIARCALRGTLGDLWRSEIVSNRL
jgi:4-amino-4-deoxy-L-arabinose transferase-like glycosyltransferase